MAMRMMCDAYLLESAGLGSPGIDQLRWLKPVYPGDTPHVRHGVLDARPMASKPHLGRVLTMQGWGMFRRRPPA